MTTIDDAIRQALSPADVRDYDALSRELSPFGEALGMFRNPRRGVTWIVAVAGAVFVPLGVYAVWRLLHAGDVREMLAWSLLVTFDMLSLSLVKLWFWMEMQRNAVVREVKRLELQIASLAARLPHA